jgi:multidrug resistance protein
VESSTVINCTMGTALTAGATEQLAEHFHVTDEAQLVCVTSIYLVGFVIGPLIFGPLSESFGRRYIMMVCFSIFSLFTLASALAPNWPALIIFRLLTGIMASAPIAVVGGICADVYADPVTRGRAMAGFMSATSFGPCFGPILSGYLAPISWRWVFWAGLIIAGASWIPLLFMPETYGPILLKWRAQKLRKETGDQSIVAPIELEKTDIRQIMTVVLTRPFRMILFEPIVSLTCLYLSLIYGLFYMWLQSFPIIFRGTYGFSAGEEGLIFLSSKFHRLTDPRWTICSHP